MYNILEIKVMLKMYYNAAYLSSLIFKKKYNSRMIQM